VSEGPTARPDSQEPETAEEELSMYILHFITFSNLTRIIRAVTKGMGLTSLCFLRSHPTHP
jgi:hypothetical protein